MKLCKNCDGDIGIHHYQTNQCPFGGREAPMGKNQIWMETRYEENACVMYRTVLSDGIGDTTTIETSGAKRSIQAIKNWVEDNEGISFIRAEIHESHPVTVAYEETDLEYLDLSDLLANVALGYVRSGLLG